MIVHPLEVKLDASALGVEFADLKERVSNLEQSIVGLTALLLHDEESKTDPAKQYFDTFRKGARQ